MDITFQGVAHRIPSMIVQGSAVHELDQFIG